MWSDEDISGDHLLAEARVSLVKIFPQMQKQFQVLAMMMMMVMIVMMMGMLVMMMVGRRRVMMMTLVFTLYFQVCLHRPTHKVNAQLNCICIFISKCISIYTFICICVPISISLYKH